jgi:quinol monooxygenase YgiN
MGRAVHCSAMYYVVGERLLRPGAADAYIAYARRVAQDWANVTAQDAYFLCLDRDRGQRVLLVGSWPDQAAFHRAYASIPAERREIARGAVIEGTGVWQWHRLAGELRLFAHEPRVATATRFAVDRDEAAAVRDWGAALRRASRETPGLVTLQLLESIENPGAFVQLGVFADEVSADLAAEAASELPPPVELRDRRDFVGFVGFRWSQLDSRQRQPS